ncbi:MAG: CDGSH iron-sulfur domain-containing protein [Actinomycetes bacterium]|jgi:CDGSH-type Zn-finger protein|nr:CDGSH iron-sulfur domain-containing protein [Actinomycetes bacterium]
MSDVANMRIDVTPHGPYAVTGGVPLVRVKIVTNDKGESVSWEQTGSYEVGECYVLCRCGHSHNKPFCDGTHCEIHFDGTETATHAEYADEAGVVRGEGVDLLDDEKFCIGARFCDRAGSVWTLTEESADPKKRELAVEEAALCPSGRLAMYIEELKKLNEPEFAGGPSIAIIEDPLNKASSALWVRGGIPVYAGSGEAYETRNRQTLCRCGGSGNKPFCDASHYGLGFVDGHQED